MWFSTSSYKKRALFHARSEFVTGLLVIATLTLQHLHSPSALPDAHRTSGLESPPPPPPTRPFAPPPSLTRPVEVPKGEPRSTVPVSLTCVIGAMLVGAGSTYIRIKRGATFVPRTPTRKPSRDPSRDPPKPPPPPPSPISEDDEDEEYDDDGEEEEDDEGEEDKDDESEDDDDHDPDPDPDPFANGFETEDPPPPPPPFLPDEYLILLVILLYTALFTALFTALLQPHLPRIRKRIERLMREFQAVQMQSVLERLLVDVWAEFEGFDGRSGSGSGPRVLVHALEDLLELAFARAAAAARTLPQPFGLSQDLADATRACLSETLTTASVPIPACPLQPFSLSQDLADAIRAHFPEKMADTASTVGASAPLAAQAANASIPPLATAPPTPLDWNIFLRAVLGFAALGFLVRDVVKAATTRTRARPDRVVGTVREGGQVQKLSGESTTIGRTRADTGEGSLARAPPPTIIITDTDAAEEVPAEAASTEVETKPEPSAAVPHLGLDEPDAYAASCSSASSDEYNDDYDRIPPSCEWDWDSREVQDEEVEAVLLAYTVDVEADPSFLHPNRHTGDGDGDEPACSSVSNDEYNNNGRLLPPDCQRDWDSREVQDGEEVEVEDTVDDENENKNDRKMTWKLQEIRNGEAFVVGPPVVSGARRRLCVPTFKDRDGPSWNPLDIEGGKTVKTGLRAFIDPTMSPVSMSSTRLRLRGPACHDWDGLPWNRNRNPAILDEEAIEVGLRALLGWAQAEVEGEVEGEGGHMCSPVRSSQDDDGYDEYEGGEGDGADEGYDEDMWDRDAVDAQLARFGVVGVAGCMGSDVDGVVEKQKQVDKMDWSWEASPTSPVASPLEFAARNAHATAVCEAGSVGVNVFGVVVAKEPGSEVERVSVRETSASVFNPPKPPPTTSAPSPPPSTPHRKPTASTPTPTLSPEDQPIRTRAALAPDAPRTKTIRQRMAQRKAKMRARQPDVEEAELDLLVEWHYRMKEVARGGLGDDFDFDMY